MHPALRLGLAALLFALGAGAPARAAEWRLRLAFAEKRVDVTAAEFAKLKTTEVVARDHEGQRRFRGVAVADLLRLVDAPPGGRLRRPTLSLVVRVTGADGFVCAFALAEFVEGFTDRTIILATHLDGAPLSADLGPLRLIAPKDTRLARWVRQVVSLEVVSIDTAAPPTTDSAARADDHRKFVPAK